MNVSYCIAIQLSRIDVSYHDPRIVIRYCIAILLQLYTVDINVLIFYHMSLFYLCTLQVNSTARCTTHVMTPLF